MESIRDNRQILNTYAEQGWKLVPVHNDSRHPHYNGWQKTDFPLDHILDDMKRGHGVGVQTGPPSGGLVVVDLDSHYARVCAGDFLPPTLEIAKEGEADGLSSLWLYYSTAAPKITVKPLDDKADKGAVVELLGAPAGQGRQFIVPPSTHKRKGAYEWVDGFDPERIATLDAADLETRVRRLGVAALIAEHLPKSGLHDFSLELAGLMGRDDRESEEAVDEILISAWRANGLIKADGSGLRQNVRDTFKALAAGKKVKGGTELNKTVPGLAQKIAAALGFDERDDSDSAKGNQAQRLIRYAMADAAELFVDQNGAEHALIDGAPARLDRGCYGWLRRLFWEHEEAPATTELLGTVAGQLRAFAEVSGNERFLHLRAAQHEGAVYLYLGPGRVARVDSGGWTLDPDPPVMFRRVLNLKELPDPERGGSLELLDVFITAKDDRDHRLAKAWLVLALLADVPRPILLAHGPQGSTKSSVQRVLKNIIDPAKPETLKLREKDFEQNINKSFIPFFDNVSTITDYMADELSKAVTGAGNAVRKLYEDDEDVIREYKRAMLLNGLVIPTEKADLIDRILPVALRRVPPAERQTERRMQALFEDRHAPLLGAVLDALSGALANHAEVRGLPRLADWAEYAIALYKQLGWNGYDGFMADWAVIEEGQHATTLEASTLAQAAVRVVEEHGTVQKSPSDMLDLLTDAADSEGLNPGNDKEFPQHANWLWRKLVPVVPTLESMYITVTDGQDDRKKRYIRLSRDSVGPDGGDSISDSIDSTENMVSPSDPHTYAAATAETASTPYFPKNRKQSIKGIDKEENEEGVLQDGKNAVDGVGAVGGAYLSQPDGDTISPDGVGRDGNGVAKRAADYDALSFEARHALTALQSLGNVATGRDWQACAAEDQDMERLVFFSARRELLDAGVVTQEGGEYHA